MQRGGWNYPPGEFRVSDADRDQALSELSAAFQAGRITADELDERSGQAVRSRTGRELTGLLADLPVERAAAVRATPVSQSNRAAASRVATVAAIGAFCSLVVAAGAVVVSAGPTQGEKAFARAAAARQGLPPPVFQASHGFDWAGVITPTAIAVLLVVLVIVLRTRMSRSDRRPQHGSAGPGGGAGRRT